MYWISPGEFDKVPCSKEPRHCWGGCWGNIIIVIIVGNHSNVWRCYITHNWCEQNKTKGRSREVFTFASFTKSARCLCTQREENNQTLQTDIAQIPPSDVRRSAAGPRCRALPVASCPPDVSPEAPERPLEVRNTASKHLVTTTFPMNLSWWLNHTVPHRILLPRG